MVDPHGLYLVHSFEAASKGAVKRYHDQLHGAGPLQPAPLLSIPCFCEGEQVFLQCRAGEIAQCVLPQSASVLGPLIANPKIDLLRFESKVQDDVRMYRRLLLTARWWYVSDCRVSIGREGGHFDITQHHVASEVREIPSGGTRL